MQLTHLNIPIEGYPYGVSQPTLVITWAANNKKLAVCGRERIIYILDEDGELKDKFPARPAEPKSMTSRDGSGKSGVTGSTTTLFKVLDMTFSPDSGKLATSQSDGIIHIFKMSEGFKEKKSVLSKLTQPKAVTCMIWGSELEIICSLLDGKLRHTPVSVLRGARSKTFYDSECPNVTLVSRNNGTQIAAGFADGTIPVFSAGNGDVPVLKFVIRHNCPPYALAFNGEAFLVSGTDKIIVVYNEKGKSIQTFDYSRSEDKCDREFGAAAIHPNGQYVVFGGINRVRMFRYMPRNKAWVEDGFEDIPNLQAVDSLKWSEDGHKIALGTWNGALHLFETSLKYTDSDLFEIFYIDPTKVVIHIKINDEIQMEISSRFGTEILDVDVLGNLKYAIASTMETFIFCDLERRLTSEITWPDTSGNERFFFGNPCVCIAYNIDYFTLVEYGLNESLGSYRTELINPHVISVRINERLSRQSNQTNKKLAYLMDLRTITLVDLELSLTLGHVTHDSKIDWLELNETGSKLLFRDIKLRLNLVDVETLTKTKILTSCNFAQWVPGSDVAVGQLLSKLCVWYNINAPEQISEIETKGVAFNVIKAYKKTFVQVRESPGVSSYHLDESRIEFGTAMEDGDLLRAVLYLELGSQSTEEEKRLMWKQLQKRALELGDLGIYERAAAGSNEISKAKYIRDTLNVARNALIYGVEPTIVQTEMQARVCLLTNQIKHAEKSFLENDDIESCISMYESIHKWQDALRLANKTNHSLIPQLTENFLSHLFQTGQDELAADFLQANGNYEAAVSTFLNAGIHTKAAKLIKQHVNQMEIQPQWIELTTKGLLESDFYPELAEFLAAIGRKKEALEYFKKAKQFDRAVQLAKENFPQMVVDLEEEWGNCAFAARQFDEACHHYIESGHNRKALTAAIEARHWDKAMNIIGAIDDINSVSEEYNKLADHFAQVNDGKKAEHCYAMIGQLPKAIDMYIQQEAYEDAYRIAGRDATLKKEVERSLIAKAEKLQDAGRFKAAEKVLSVMGEINLVISMYAKRKMYEDMLRLVEKHHPSHIESSRKHVAELLRKEKNYRSAEQYYIKSGEYKEALSMYEDIGQWEDAHRVAREHGGSSSAKRVVYMWANSLGGETGIRLLKRHNCFNNSVQYLCESKKFDFAFEVAKQSSIEVLQSVHVAYARHLIESGEYSQATEHFLMGNTYKEAIEMYKNMDKIDEAIHIAEQYGSVKELQDILLKQAQNAFDRRDFKVFEAAILKAQKPEIGINLYKERGMWTEAFRLCKEYAPVLLQELQNEYDAETNGSGERLDDKDAQLILQQAREFEKIGEYKRAVENYLKLTPSNTHSVEFLLQCLTRAGNIAVKFMDKEEAQPLVTRLAVIFREFKKYSEAAIMCIDVELYYEALDSLIEGQMWNEAKDAAKDFGLEYEQYVVKKHTIILQTSGQVDELSNVNLTAALELLVEQGEWEKCLEKAKYNKDALYHYMAVYIKYLLKNGNPETASRVYVDYGFPFVPMHFQILRLLAHSCFVKYDIEDYDKWADLRNICLPLLQKSEEKEYGTPLHAELESLLYLTHLHVLRAACIDVNGLEIIPIKISIALVRYTNVLPPEKYFFNAGQMCKDAGWSSMAFVFLNQYMDIREAIEDGKTDTSDVDYSAFVDTDIPNVVPLEHYTLIPQTRHDETREWVLSASMDRNIQQVLQRNEHGDYTASLTSVRDGIIYKPCLISGYPVIGPKITFRGKDKCANKDDWNRFVVAAKSEQYPRISEAYQFIVDWCGSNPNYSM